MKTVSDDLFKLIKSLTQFEKGYFKKYASRNTAGGKNNYIILFDAIDKMESYNEELLKKKLRSVLPPSQIPVYKNYLFNLILKSLQGYSSYESVDIKINELISNANMLCKKAMYKEALKYLKKAKSMAEKYENTKALLEILLAERAIVMTVPDKNIYEYRSELYRQQMELVEAVTKHIKLAWLSDSMVMHIEARGDFRSEENEKEMNKILNDPLLKNYNDLKDFTSKRYYYHSHMFNELSKENIKKVHFYLKRELELISEYKHMIPLFIRTYIQSLVNYLLFSNILKDRASVKDALAKINELKRKIKNKIPVELEITILANTCYAEIIIFTNNAELVKGRAAAKRIEALLEKYPDEVPLGLKAVLLINTAKFYFIDSNFAGSLFFINKMINEIPPSFKKDLYDFARMFQLLIHFELGNLDVLDNAAEAAYRFLRERKAVFAVEKAVFDFLRNALKAVDSDYKDLYDDLVYNLEASKHLRQSRITLSNFDYYKWAKSKINGKPLHQLMRL
jgi:hypothetical protein